MPSVAEAVAAWDRWVAAHREWSAVVSRSAMQETKRYDIPLEGMGQEAWRQEVEREAAWARMDAARRAWDAVVERGQRAVRARGGR